MSKTSLLIGFLAGGWMATLVFLFLGGTLDYHGAADRDDRLEALVDLFGSREVQADDELGRLYANGYYAPRSPQILEHLSP